MPKKILFSSMKDEAPFIVEWLAYYKVLGFDEFHIAYNESNDNTAELLKALEAAGELTAYENRFEFSTRPQGNAAEIFNKANIVKEGDWVFWPDTDEFLNIHIGQKKLDDLIAYLDKDNCDAMLVQWRVFGDSGHPGVPKRMIAHDMVGASAVNFKPNREIKTIWKCSDKFTGFGVQCIHRPLLNTSAQVKPRAILSNGNHIRWRFPHNENWLKGLDTGKTNYATRSPSYPAIAQVNHYSVRSPDCLLLKQVRGRGWAPSGSQIRHNDEFYERYNRNEFVDVSILQLLPALNGEIERLMGLPDIALLHHYAQTNMAKRLQEIRSEPETPVKPGNLVPELTLPQEEAGFLDKCLISSQGYLEYGSGGSTILALEKGIPDVFSVESDLKWAENIGYIVAEKGLNSPSFRMHKVYIGPVGDWARPTTLEFARHFERYPNSVWERHDFVHPDLVLIDGRFRVACFVTCAVNAEKPIRILFDDYPERPYYHTVEEIAQPTKIVGRMAVFDIEPGRLSARDFGKFIRFYTDSE